MTASPFTPTPYSAAAIIIPSSEAFTGVRVAGMTVLARAVCALGRVADPIHILETPAFSARDMVALEAEMRGREYRPRLQLVTSSQRVPAQDGAILVSAPAVFDPRLCARLLDLAGLGDVLRCGHPNDATAPLWFVAGDKVPRFTQLLAQGQDPLQGSDGTRLTPIDLHPETSLCTVISDESSRRRTEAQLLRAACKPSDTPMAKYVDRRISNWITRRVAEWRFTPNQLTLANGALGLLGGAFLLGGTYGTQLLGALLLALSIVLDGCDGELARLKFMESSTGHLLDFVVDNVVNVVAIFAVGAGYAFRHNAAGYLYLSIANAALAMASIWPVYSLFFRRQPKSGPPPGTDRGLLHGLAANLSGRDFVYLILVLAIFGKAHWFAPLCFVGITLFMPLAVGLALIRGNVAKKSALRTPKMAASQRSTAYL